MSCTEIGASYDGSPERLVTRFIVRDEGRIAFDDTGGEGPVVLAIHGMGDTRDQYRFVRMILQQAGYRVVTMDVRGCGETSVQWQDYSARAAGEDALMILRELGVKRVVIVGHSFAAGAALWAAQQASDCVAGIVMLGPVVRDISMPWYIKLLFRLGFAGFWRVRFWLAYWQGLFITKKPYDFISARARLGRNLRETGRMEALYRMICDSKLETEKLLSVLRLPVLIVMGEKDPDFKNPRKEAEWIAGCLPSEVVMVKDAGHYPHVEFPDCVSSEIMTFCADLGKK